MFGAEKPLTFNVIFEVKNHESESKTFVYRPYPWRY